MKWTYAAFLFLLGACSNPGREASVGMYYDLASYIQQQINRLEKQNPTVVKRIGLDSERELQTLRNINWAHELNLFLQADINKKAYRSSYQQLRSESMTFEYRLKTGEDLPVRYLRVELDTSSRQPRQIKAILSTKNLLYELERNVWLKSEHGVLKWYRIDGFQQLTWLPKKTFRVEGEIQ